MINVSDTNLLKSYLIDKKIAGERDQIEIISLTGGVSNQVLKIILPQKRLVLKQALAKLNVKDDWFADISRINTEKNCLVHLNKIIPDNVPAIVFEDESNYLYIMECLPEAAVNWKSDLLTGIVHPIVALETARCLAQIHNSFQADETIKHQFSDKRMFDELRIDPYYRHILKKHPELSEFTFQVIESTLACADTLVLGDFSPKNIMVMDNRVFLLDFEVAHTGDPAFDIAFMMNHLLLKGIKFAPGSTPYQELAEVFYEQYMQNVRTPSKDHLPRRVVHHLALLMLSRIDGKSPVEYLNDRNKQVVTDLAYTIINSHITDPMEIFQLYSVSE